MFYLIYPLITLEKKGKVNQTRNLLWQASQNQTIRYHYICTEIVGTYEFLLLMAILYLISVVLVIPNIHNQLPSVNLTSIQINPCENNCSQFIFPFDNHGFFIT